MHDDDTPPALASLSAELRRLRRRLAALELLGGAALALLLVGAIRPSSSEVLRARGLVLEDEGGRALWRLGWLAWLRGAYDDAVVSWGRVLTTRGGRAHRGLGLGRDLQPMGRLVPSRRGSVRLGVLSRRA